MERICKMYHICREFDKFDYSKGYIGVSFHPEKRWEHHRNRNENPHLRNSINKYQDIIYYVFIEGSEDYCYELEEELRPKKNMGWNINMGGSRPPSPKGTHNCISKIRPDQRRKNFKHTQATKDKLSQWYEDNKDYFSDIKKGSLNPMYYSTGEDNPNFQGYYITPEGIFDNENTAGAWYNVSRSTISNVCRSNDCKIERCYSLKKYCKKGCTWKSRGFWFLRKEDKEIMNKEDIAKIFNANLPRIYQFKDETHIRQIVNSLPNLEEGFVLYNPDNEPVVKIKSEAYLKAHRLKGEGLTPKRAIEMVVIGECDEYFAVFPEDKPYFEKYLSAWNTLESLVETQFNKTKSLKDQKEFALQNKVFYSGVMFKAKSSGNCPVKTLHNLQTSYKVKLLESTLEMLNEE